MPCGPCAEKAKLRQERRAEKMRVADEQRAAREAAREAKKQQGNR